MISLKFIGLLIFAFLAVMMLSRLIVNRIGKHTSRRWVSFCYLVIALIPFLELIKMLFLKDGVCNVPFFVFWLLFFMYCFVMFLIEMRKFQVEETEVSE